MKHIAQIVLTILTIGCSTGVFSETVSFGGNFSMIHSTNVLLGGTNDVVFSWDGTLNNSVSSAVSNATITSDEAYFGLLWNIHDVAVYGPGDYTIYDGCDPGNADCGVGNAVSFSVASNQVGAHMLFDWPADSTSPNNLNMDIINVWSINTTWSDQNPTNPFYSGLDDGSGCTSETGKPDCVIDGLPNTNTTIFGFVSTDFNNDGIAGAGTTDGPTVGVYANFNLSPVPIPAAVWLFGSGLLGLVGTARRKTAA